MSSLNDDGNLQIKLAHLAKAARAEPTGDAEMRLRSAYRDHFRKRKSRAVRIYAAAAVAACLLLAIFFTFARRDVHRRPALYMKNSAMFIALPYGQSEVPMEQGVIVRVNLSPRELRALGVPMDGSPPHSRPADLLIAQDGVARAIRLVDTNTQQ